ncbi:MAG: APC family permease [Phycisphaerales bacterium]|nr:APC family permease [Planctomycetota bacterium]MCH8507155.1 APC family permease [Phycisphaerales bacterium]
MADHDGHNHRSEYRSGSLTLTGSIALGTGVMIGAGIFVLTGQVAELAGGLFPLAFIAAAIVVAFSAYSYIKVCNKYPSAGGIAMILKKAYGPGVVTAGCSMLMYFSMVINESLVARTFGTYTLRIFGIGSDSWLVPTLGVGLIAFAFAVNLMGNKVIGGLSKATAIIKIGGIAVFAGIGLWVSGLSFDSVVGDGAASQAEGGIGGFLAAVALSILAYKGFTTITNSGDELKEPKKNVGSSILFSLLICTGLYLLVTLAVAGNLSVDEIIAARDSSLAEAARPAVGPWGEWLTIGLAIVATVSGIIASMFAVSRMLAMLTDMELVPHRHFGMPGRIQKHTLVYTAVLAITLTVFFDLGRIASLGAIFYIVMDMAIHWGIFRYLRRDLGARGWILLTAIVLDAVVLGAFLWMKLQSDPLVVAVAAVGMGMIFAAEWWFLRRKDSCDDESE